MRCGVGGHRCMVHTMMEDGVNDKWCYNDVCTGD